ncbi:MAG TPA: hypothetical protein VFG69_21045 [Nannocystaceae bacterium]|nr:hypothetical protein [Nannocystaceae bacterium]
MQTPNDRRVITHPAALLVTVALSIGIACNSDTQDGEPSGDSGGCTQCGSNLQGPFGCECRDTSGSWFNDGLGDHCIQQQADAAGYCKNVACDDHDDGKPVSACAEEISSDCRSWNPSSHITLSGGVHSLSKAWLATVIADPSPLWGCDDVILRPLTDNTGFQVQQANSGEMLYELGLRNNDKPLTLNGIALTNFNQSYVAYNLWLNNVTSYTLKVKRGTSTITLSYQLTTP